MRRRGRLVALLAFGAAGTGCVETNYDDPKPGRVGPFTALALGYDHTCGLLEDGSIDCWGEDSYEQQALESLGPFLQLVAHYYYSCGLTAEGTVQCAGWLDE